MPVAQVETETRAVQGTSIMAGLIRSYRWEETPLGPISGWSETLLATVNMLLSAPLSMQLLWGEEMTVLYNDPFISQIGGRHPEVLGMSARECWGEAWPVVGEQLSAAFEDGTATLFHGVPIPLNLHGVVEEVYWDYSYSPISEPDGRIVGVLDICQNVTAAVQAAGRLAASEETRKQAEARVERSEERLRLALTAANGVGTWDWDIPADLVYANERFAEAYGVGTAEATAGVPISRFLAGIHPEDRPRVGEEIASALRSGEEYVSDYRLLDGNGTVRWITARGRCQLDPAGNPLRFPGVTVDITERKAVEENLRRSEERLQFAIDAADLGAWLYDPERSVVAGDERMVELFGLEVAEAPAERWLGGNHEDDRERVGQELQASLEGAAYDTEDRVQNGSITRWIKSKARLLGAARGVMMVGLCEDVTERKLTEQALLTNNERLRLAEKAGDIATFEWNVKTDTLSWDHDASWVYGRPPDDITCTRGAMEFILPEDRAGLTKAMTDAIDGIAEFDHEFRVSWPDGSIHWLIARGTLVNDAHGKPARMVGVNLDITDRRQTEAALRQSEKLAAVGQLASTIAHEINNPLEAVTNLLYLARHNDELSEIQRYIDIAETELRRASAITNQTLRFHKQLSNPTEVHCEDLFEGVLMIYQGRLHNSEIQLEKRKRATHPVLCFEGEIRQVLNNLVGNAIDAMRDGGRLLLRSSEATDWKTGRKGLRLTVADTGSGMSPVTLRRIFDAFFTTKGINGTGLGLWVSQEIIERHHGNLRVRSSQAPGRSGTVFNLFLPFEAVDR